MTTAKNLKAVVSVCPPMQIATTLISNRVKATKTSGPMSLSRESLWTAMTLRRYGHFHIKFIHYNVHVYFIFQAWKIFDCGSKEVTCPLVCIPPVSGSADIFYLQCIALSNKGYRVISVRDF